MASSICFTTSLTSVNSLNRPSTGLINPNSSAREVLRISDLNRNSNKTRFQSLEARANTDNVQNMKTNSLVCPDCEGNGAVVCSQCKGDGINSTDHYNGRFKAGAICWLCRGKKDILCGNCNGAGFCGGFMSSADD